MQFIHFKTRLVIFLVDVKVADVKLVADIVSRKRVEHIRL